MNRTTDSSGQMGAARRRWYHRVGPGLITACVVIGPGSILTSSQVGSQYGFAMSWVVVVAVMFMLVYTSLGAKLGVIAADSPGDLVARLAGRPLAVLIGAGVFFISASFQFGNNLGVDSAFRAYADTEMVRRAREALGFEVLDYTIIAFNALTIAFLFGFRNLYRAVERLMMTFVALMLLSFVANLMYARPPLAEMARGFVPHNPATVGLSLLGLVGTTFVITAAYFQTYLVRQKGWRQEQLRDGLMDARIGAIIMAVITLTIMSTAGSVLRGEELTSVGGVAAQLKPLFGRWGQTLFCLGLFSAAYSSFLVNSMIGGFILSDGLGLGSRPEDLFPKLFTAGVLLTGMSIAWYVIRTGVRPVPAIVAAQAVTVIAAPLMAGALLWLTNRKDIMGDNRNSIGLNLAGGIGFVLLLAMAWYTAAEKVWPAIRDGLSGGS